MYLLIGSNLLCGYLPHKGLSGDADLERAICSSKPASPPEEHKLRGLPMGFPAPRFPLRLSFELPWMRTHPERSLQGSGEEVGALVGPLHALVLGALCVWQGAGR